MESEKNIACKIFFGTQCKRLRKNVKMSVCNELGELLDEIEGPVFDGSELKDWFMLSFSIYDSLDLSHAVFRLFENEKPLTNKLIIDNKRSYKFLFSSSNKDLMRVSEILFYASVINTEWIRSNATINNQTCSIVASMLGCLLLIS